MASKFAVLRSAVVIILIIMSVSVGLSTVSAQEAGKACQTESSTKKISHADSVDYTLTFNSCKSVRITAKHTTESPIDTGFVIEVDGEFINRVQFTQSNGEEQKWTYNITPYLDVTRTNHTITVSTLGDYTTYNFTRDLSVTDTEHIPRPHITDVKISNGTINGEPSAIAEVTVANPSIQHYGSKLVVYTEGTDGSFYDATVPPGENRTITVELLDKRGDKVAGEARLYEGNITNEDLAFDQVEFVGRAGANTTTWNESYEPVEGPWRDDHYVYQNESIETGADKNGAVPDLSETQLLYAGAGIALVGLGGLKRLLT